MRSKGIKEAIIEPSAEIDRWEVFLQVLKECRPVLEVLSRHKACVA